MVPNLVSRLAAHRTLSPVPRAQLEWLAARGESRTLAKATVAMPRGEAIDELWVVLAGRLSVRTAEGGPRKMMEWHGGDVTGLLPYSRLQTAIGNVEVEEATEALVLHRDHFPEMIRECHDLTSVIVHLMLDRARHFTSGHHQAEKMASLGRLAAGLAHELNNPASAVVRTAGVLMTSLTEQEAAFQALGEASLSPQAQEAFRRAADKCATREGATSVSPLRRAAREDALADWLDQRGADPTRADLLADSAISVDDLEALEHAFDAAAFGPALRALVAGCSVRMLVSEIENAASRVHNLVAAVKGFTYMDQAAAPTPVDVARGLADTLAVMKSKALTRSVELTLTLESGLPLVQGFGGELNQVWGNLIDNAIEAAPEGGQVGISVARDGGFLVVQVVDDGHGIPAASLDRVFEPFFTTKAVGEGTGLGLDIAGRLVRQHEGVIEVQSRPGHTVFSVRLPIVATLEET